MKTRGSLGLLGSLVVLGIGFFALGGAGCDQVLGLDGVQVGCSQGQSKCIDEKTRVECGAFGKWDSFPITCTNAKICEESTGLCVPACEPGQLRCVGDEVLEECSLSAEWKVKEACSFACSESGCKCDTSSPFGCTLNNERERCVDGLWQIEPMGKCIGKTCSEGICKGECEPGRRCVDNSVQECDAVGQWGKITPCQAGDVCSGGECIKECKNGDLRCNNNAQQACVGSVWKEIVNCSDIGKTCIDGSAKCGGVCVKDETRCVGGSLESCDAFGLWQEVVDCSWINQTCIDNMGKGGSCVGDCAQGAPSCFGNTVSSCHELGTRVFADCGAMTCLDGACKGSCGPASGQCLGYEAQACNSMGNFETVSMCSTGCLDGTCNRPSCDAFAPECGQNQNEYCCASPLVWGGTYKRSNDPTAKATVADFRLDRYEITVGRFRKFVAEYDTFRPTLAPGLGAHPLLVGSGWKAGWDQELKTSAVELQASLVCSAASTWMPNAGPKEGLPLNCLTWYEAFAFCIWDGGFLPTEAEWNYAAAGGEEQRMFPWSVPASSTNIGLDRAAYNCLADGPFDFSNCSAFSAIPPVGSSSPLGNGKFGQSDLAGSLLEWTLDVFEAPYPSLFDCVNCAAVDDVPGSQRVVRGGAWSSDASSLTTPVRGKIAPNQRSYAVGARCARKP